ncbi:MAG: hypothetical protein OEY59_13640 [Deltaproteobacteria bacterium]|nr:hypothetical protein [Deltaproteobacteria bacterium]
MQDLIDTLYKLWPMILAIVIFGAVLWKNQRLILSKLADFDRRFDRQDEHLKSLYGHKEDCLKRRTVCENQFLTKDEHARLHMK